MRIAITDRAHTFHLFSKDYPLFLKLVFLVAYMTADIQIRSYSFLMYMKSPTMFI